VLLVLHTPLESYELIAQSGSRVMYQVFVLLAAIVGGYLIRKDALSWPLSKRQSWVILSLAFFGAMVGCAIPAFIAGGMIEELAWDALVSPKTVLGGIFFSFVFVSIYKRIINNHANTSDAFARGAIAMMAIGRIGCLFQHCCYGVPVSWGFDFGDGIPRVPVQYFEAIGLILLMVFMQSVHSKNRFSGQRIFIVFFLYGLMRFLLEFLREQIAGVYLGIGFYQWFALCLALVGAWQIIKRRPTLNLAPIHEPVARTSHNERREEQIG